MICKEVLLKCINKEEDSPYLKKEKEERKKERIRDKKKEGREGEMKKGKDVNRKKDKSRKKNGAPTVGYDPPQKRGMS